MPKFQFEQDPASDTDDWTSRPGRLINLVVRGLGLILLVIGFVVALMVIHSAWTLLDDPQSIEPFAAAVERGSNLDLTLSSAAASARRDLESPAATLTPDGADPASPGANTVNNASTPNSQAAPPPGLRFSYFVAWLISILLLLLIGRLAIAAIRTGGELALYDVKVGKLARALLRERTRAE